MVSVYLLSVWYGKGRMPCGGAAPVISHVKMVFFSNGTELFGGVFTEKGVKVSQKRVLYHITNHKCPV